MAVDVTRLASATQRVPPCTGSGKRGGSGRKPVPQGQAPRRARAGREGGEGDRRPRTEGNKEEAGGRVGAPVHIWPQASLCATSQGGDAPCAGRFGIPAEVGEAAEGAQRAKRGSGTEGEKERERAEGERRRRERERGGGGDRGDGRIVSPLRSWVQLHRRPQSDYGQPRLYLHDNDQEDSGRGRWEGRTEEGPLKVGM